MKTTRPVFSVIAAALAATALLQSHHGHTESIAPIWTPGLMLGSWLEPEIPNDSRDDLQRQLQATWGRAFEMRTRSAKQQATMVESCPEASNAARSGAELAFRYEYYAYWLYLTECRAVELMVEARASERSYVRSFRLDQDALGKLPALLAHGAVEPSMYEERRRDKTATIDNVQRTETVTVKAPHSTTYYDGEDAQQTMTIVGYGDFDGDGTEDLLLKVEDAILSVRGYMVRLFQLTRRRDDGSLQLLREEDLSE